MKTANIHFKTLFICLLAVVCISITPAIAQEEEAKDTTLPYKELQTIPYYQLQKTDSSFFNMQDAAKNRAAVVILFSPTCGHCQHQAEEITGNMQQFKDVTFIFVSTYPLTDIKKYVADYGLSHFPNVYVGYDASMKVLRFYRPHGLPGIYVYDKKGKLAKEFPTNVHAKELAEALGNK